MRYSFPTRPATASSIAETLRSAGFSVIEGSDLDKAGMTRLLDQFTEAAYDADIALVFYAGHGMQVDGRNYLVPVDARTGEGGAAADPHHSGRRAVLAALPPDPAVGIIILDACRDNPLARTLARALPTSRSTSVGAGLAPVQANGQSTDAGGLLIAYATDPGAVAYDGKARTAPTRRRSPSISPTPGLEIQSALTRVRAEVSEATGGAQRPWHNASLAREVFIGGEPPAAESPPRRSVRHGAAHRRRRTRRQQAATSTGPSSRSCGTRPRSATRSRTTSSILRNIRRAASPASRSSTSIS